MREVKVVENQSYERMQKIQAKRSNEESVLQALTKQSQLPETEKEPVPENEVKNEDASQVFQMQADIVENVAQDVFAAPAK